MTNMKHIQQINQMFQLWETKRKTDESIQIKKKDIEIILNNNN